MTKRDDKPTASERIRAARERERYYSDREYRESLPCSECGKAGGCVHFPAEARA